MARAEYKTGDWTCAGCGDHQFARNRVCRKCGAQPPSAVAPAGPHVYVLRLQDGCYYVGQSARPVDERLLEHLTGAGAMWTRLHAVEGVERVLPGDGWVELQTTVELMRTHGMERVRGGPFCNVELTDSDRANIQTLLDTTGNACYECHAEGHMARECPLRAARGTKRPAPVRPANGEERAPKRARISSEEEYYASLFGCAIM